MGSASLPSLCSAAPGSQSRASSTGLLPTLISQFSSLRSRTWLDLSFPLHKLSRSLHLFAQPSPLQTLRIQQMHRCFVKGFSELPHLLPVMRVPLFTRACSLHRSLMRVGPGTQDGLSKCLLEGTACGRALYKTVYSLGSRVHHAIRRKPENQGLVHAKLVPHLQKMTEPIL